MTWLIALWVVSRGQRRLTAIYINPVFKCRPAPPKPGMHAFAEARRLEVTSEAAMDSVSVGSKRCPSGSISLPDRLRLRKPLLLNRLGRAVPRSHPRSLRTSPRLIDVMEHRRLGAVAVAGADRRQNAFMLGHCGGSDGHRVRPV